jgi:hypothetical protein
MGRINEARTAAEVVESTMAGFHSCLSQLNASYA